MHGLTRGLGDGGYRSDEPLLEPLVVRVRLVESLVGSLRCGDYCLASEFLKHQSDDGPDLALGCDKRFSRRLASRLVLVPNWHLGRLTRSEVTSTAPGQ